MTAWISFMRAATTETGGSSLSLDVLRRRRSVERRRKPLTHGLENWSFWILASLAHGASFCVVVAARLMTP